MKAFILACMLLGLGACASRPPAEVADAQKAQKEQREKNCVRDTGTRIKSKEGDQRCVDGKVITAEDLEQTGAATVGEALRRLPPR